MKIVIIGQGSVGTKLGLLFTSAGHSVTWVGRNDLDSVLVSPDTVVILALPFSAVSSLESGLVSQLEDGQILVDATNPLKEDWSPLAPDDESFPIPRVGSAAEAIQVMFPRAQVVKCFNTVFADNMLAERLQVEPRITTFVASDHEEALSTVTHLANSIGFQAVPTGPLSTARYREAMAHLNIQLAVGQKRGTATGFIYFDRSQNQQDD